MGDGWMEFWRFVTALHNNKPKLHCSLRPKPNPNSILILTPAKPCCQNLPHCLWVALPHTENKWLLLSLTLSPVPGCTHGRIVSANKESCCQGHIKNPNSDRSLKDYQLLLGNQWKTMKHVDLPDLLFEGKRVVPGIKTKLHEAPFSKIQ